MKNEKRHEREKRREKLFRPQLWHIIACVVLLILMICVYEMTKFDRVVPNSTLGVVVTTQSEQTTEPTEESTQAPTTEAPTEASETQTDTENTGESTEPVTDNAAAMARALMETMTTEEKLLQMFIVSPEELTYSDVVTIAGEFTQNALDKYPVGGMYYSSQNILSDEQFSNMIEKSQSFCRCPMFMVVDREGDSASRLSTIGVVRNTSSQSALAEEDVTMLRGIGRELAQGMRSVGLNLDLAPVADVRTVTNDRIGNRSFGSDGDAVYQRVSAMMEGMKEGGMISCLKYFPGYGSTSDSVVDRTLEELRQTEFAVFKNGIDAGAEMIMASHLVLAEADTVPSDLSVEVVTKLLREELGFKGVVITEAHNLPVITERYTSGQAALLAIQAGCDIILLPEDFYAAYQTLLKAANDGSLSEARINESVLRILTLKYRAGIMD